jgi:hypothetical protein
MPAEIMSKLFDRGIKPLIGLFLRWLSIPCILLAASGCAVSQTEPTVRVALLAPFEGRYREIGYNALYAARLALDDYGKNNTELLAVDDGGSVENAADRARALAQDPQVKTVVVLGYAATDKTAQQAFGQLPVLIVGNWSVEPQTDTVFVLSNPQINQRITTMERIEVVDTTALDAPFTGGEILALEQFAKLRQSLDDITMVSSALLPDANFTERYLSSGQFTPKPGLLATLTYDAAAIAIQAAQTQNPAQTTQTQAYTGLNGVIQFENGYWIDAPIHDYRYNADRQLIELETAALEE